MKLKLIMAKFAGSLLRLFKKGGNLPGVILSKNNEHVLKEFVLPKDIILITGTNGKTSLTNQVAEVFRRSGRKVLTNSEGNNMYTGVATLFARHADFNFKVQGDIVILEIDEMSLAKVMADIAPTVVVVNNLFRDQLDRVGEMENLIVRIQGAVAEYKGALLLNGDDPNVARLGLSHPYSVYFGVDKNEQSTLVSNDAREGRICPSCQSFIDYQFYNYSHLGRFNCPRCEFGDFKHDFYVSDINYINKEITVNGEQLVLNEITQYLAYNAVCFYSIAKLYELSTAVVQDVLKTFSVAKGRNEFFSIDGDAYFLALVKNPVGFNETMKYTVSKIKNKQINYIIAVNDFEPDGIDVSWLYDTQFEILLNENISHIICTGTRAYDLAIRLKIAGFDPSQIEVISDSQNAVTRAQSLGCETHILSCYTQLQPIRKQLLALEKGGKQSGN